MTSLEVCEMPIYYTLHNLLPKTYESDGKRNCATFMYGNCVYAIIYVILKNLQLKFGVVMDAVLSGFMMIILTDVCTMAYIYRSYYGRSILNEFAADDKAHWVYEEETHSYRSKNQAELLADSIKAEKELQLVVQEHKRTINEMKAKLRTQKIQQSKTRIRAAICIQRWWRGMLYNPPNGILYKRALESFEGLKSVNTLV